MSALDMIENTINGTLANVTGKIESFERSTNDMWRDLNGDQFKKIEIPSVSLSYFHRRRACAPQRQDDAWTKQFPTSGGGTGRRAAFIMSDIRQGIEYLQGQEDDAPMLAALNN